MSSQLPLIRQGRKCSQLVDYLSLDGVFSSGPAALLSGLKPSPEPGPPFFSCCNISCWLSTGATSSKAYGLELDQFCQGFSSLLIFPFKMVESASGIIFAIIKAEGVRQMFFPAAVPAVYRAPAAPDTYIIRCATV
ncbi:hypothetical protein Tsubulata_035363 [Turnera subulata]|uniref:Squalene monooxygenase n=1 Tax=Turnera subulata TaxID=218843 RepID=A0A9Q0JF53_9ROSI|nr:hypothetical protein Tsubulata_035363 [Turnera subulata]